MLGAIRRKSKGWVAYLIIGLIVIPFALFGIQDYVSRSANISIATVDGEDIDLNLYYQELNSQQILLIQNLIFHLHCIQTLRHIQIQFQT